ncbi:hypothetical protein Srubr_40610 [Streptomyces rubradiris]|uniref:Uncharacterized protein n=1 Tax=Streptomyces rubradiris TaxID=285531 RepID=A0ABQ3REF3_STRRR|nr:hypothetical protein GCM10018792_11660 [Streptomyces rubradiris]GHI54215.1 hypothetical protein Srubr_40610 [Streptomyces rubradiris]
MILCFFVFTDGSLNQLVNADSTASRVIVQYVQSMQDPKGIRQRKGDIPHRIDSPSLRVRQPANLRCGPSTPAPECGAVKSWV